jgi:hypothetical protein
MIGASGSLVAGFLRHHPSFGTRNFSAPTEELKDVHALLGFFNWMPYIRPMNRNITSRIEQIKADLAASEADIEVGRIVPGETVLARIQAALDRFEAGQNRDDGITAARLR